MRRTFAWLALVLTLVPAPPARASDDEVYAVIRKNFSHWDTNHDGRVDDRELTMALQDPGVHGDEAAAVATLKRVAGSDGVTLDALQRNEDQAGRIGSRTAPLPRYYKLYSEKILKANHALYSTGGPRRDSIQQGPRGDCYFLAAVGAMVSRNPGDVTKLLSNDSSGFVVTFPGRSPIHVARPTDTQIALYTSSGEDGMWLYALEKAFSDECLRDGRRSVSAESLDATGAGGDPAYSLKVLTGHTSWRFDINSMGTQDAEKRLDRTRDIRTRLTEAMSHRELLVVSSQTEGTLPAGVARQHAYALIGYNSTRDEVTLWNPWGKTQTVPRDARGSFLESFDSDHGVFTVPLDKLFIFWRALSGETA